MTDDNPLREANPFSLDELMSRDPLALRREPKHIAEQVAALRRQREKWAAADAAGKRVRNKRAKKESSAVGSAQEVASSSLAIVEGKSIGAQ